jgi:rubrerythrin
MHPMTRVNLRAALEREAMATLLYQLYADRAREDGLDAVADLFDRICRHERREHAQRLAGALGLVRSTRENLANSLEGELVGHRCAYPTFARQARLVEDEPAAELLDRLGAEENVHAERIWDALLAHARIPAEA